MYKDHMKYYFLLLFLCCFFTTTAQDSLMVKGKILDIGNIPVKDVSVSVEGMRSAPVLSDENGTFSIRVPSGDEWLILSPLGNKKSKLVYLNNKQEITIYLTNSEMQTSFDKNDLLYFSQRKRDLTVSFTDIGSDQIINRNMASVDMALQGKVPGLLSVIKSGMPGQGTTSYLRGIKSMNTINTPLIIVDGIPIESPGVFESSLDGNSFNPLSTIDPLDVSSVTISKDPVYNSLFGVKAANGVILINTLRPDATETSIKFSLQAGIKTTQSRSIPQLDNNQYRSLASELLNSSPVPDNLFDDKYPGLYVTSADREYYRYANNTKWEDLIYTSATYTNAHVAVNSGSETAKHGLSVGFHREEGILKNTFQSRFNVRFNSDLTILSWFRLNLAASLAGSNANQTESAISRQTNPISSSLAKAPILGPYQVDDEGQQLNYYDEVDELGISNPLALVNTFIGENRNYRFMTSFKGQADISKQIKFNTLLGVNLNTLKEYIFKPNIGIEPFFFGEADNVSQSSNDRIFSVYTDNYFTYDKRFKSAHQLNALSGLRMQFNSSEFDFGEAKNLPENDQYTNLQSGMPDYRVITGDIGKWNWLSFYNKLDYKYKDKYLLNLLLTTDFSSRVGKEAETLFSLNNQPFGLFYSIGAGWRLSDEFFFKNIEALDNLLLRASYGISGNDGIGNLSSFRYYNSVRFRETTGLIPAVLYNDALKYEETAQLNIGIDISLRGDRTNISANYFHLTTNDMLVYVPQKTYTGVAYRPENSGKTENRGFEVSVFHRIINSSDFSWDIIPVVTFQANKVLETGGLDLITPFAGGNFITTPGYEINSFYGFQYNGVYSTSDEAMKANLVNHKGIPFGAGDAKFSDISGPENKPDGVINEYDRVVLGCPQPDYFGSISNRFTYRRWAFDFMFQFVTGNEVFNYVRYLNERMSDLSNQSASTLRRWQYEGNNTNIPRALYNDPTGNALFSSRWIEDGSYIRFKQLTLSYTVPDKILFFRNAAFYFTMENIVTFSRYLGYDPEFSYSVRPMEQGLDYGMMPQSLQLMAGIRFGL